MFLTLCINNLRRKNSARRGRPLIWIPHPYNVIDPPRNARQNSAPHQRKQQPFTPCLPSSPSPSLLQVLRPIHSRFFPSTFSPVHYIRPCSTPRRLTLRPTPLHLQHALLHGDCTIRRRRFNQTFNVCRVSVPESRAVR